MNSRSRVFVRSRLLWVAWYPARRLRCMFKPEMTKHGWYLSIALGPLYFGLGPGIPSP